MTLKVKDAGGVLRTITSCKVMNGTTLRPIQRLKMMDGATLRTLATFVKAMTLDAGSVVVFGSGYGSDPTIVSPPVTATPTGGLAPYTYSWAQQSGNAMTISNPTSATTTFSATVPSGNTFVGVFRCTCSDSSGQTATADATVELDNIST